MFSVLYLNVMAPLNEVHRFVDEAHESSLRVGDLLGLLALPIDRSFKLAEPGSRGWWWASPCSSPTTSGSRSLPALGPERPHSMDYRSRSRTEKQLE